MPRLPYRAILALGIATLTLAAVPDGGVSAHTPEVARSQAAPVFVFPSNGQSFPLNGSMLFQVQPMSGAKGYLWSFVQGGAIMYQNLAWTGRLDGATYSIKKGSAAQRRLHDGPMQVWVRALMGNGQWSGSSSVTVQLQGDSSLQTTNGDTPSGAILQPGQMWIQQGMTAVVQKVSFVTQCSDGLVRFELDLRNATTSQLVVNFQGQDMSITDNLGNTFSGDNVKAVEQGDCSNSHNINDAVNVPALQPDERRQYVLTVRGSQSLDRAYYIVEIVQAGRIRHARWRINIPK